MEFTTNYNLNKPTDSNTVDIQDLNENMDILDAEVVKKVEKVVGKGLSTNDYSDAEKQQVADNKRNLTTHIADDFVDNELHGWRLDENKKPEYWNGTEWVRVKGDGYPVGNIGNFEAKGDDTTVELTWTDPEDVTVTDSNGNVITIARWKGTRILRKIGSYPQNENDGVLVVDNGIRDQYKTNGFTDTGLQNDVEYYYSAFPYTEDDVYTVDENNRISAIPTEIKIYGVEIDESNSNPETSVTYTDDAVGFAPMAGNNGNHQWGSWESIFNELNIKPCLVKNGVVNYYLNPDDYTKKADGSSADITSGNDGDVMIEFPKLYWKMEKLGTKQHVQWSVKQFAGAECPAHTVGSIEKENIYLPAYMGYTQSGKLRSLSGKTPTVDQTIGTFRSQAQANGSGYQQMSYYPLLMLQVLYITFYKSRDSQTALGRGYVDGNSASTTTGATNKKGMFYGETTGKQQNKFCGVEDFWGNVYYFIDGIYSNDNWNILISKQDVFNDTGSGYINHGQGATLNTNGYIDKVQGDTNTGFIIKSGSGSDSTHYADNGVLYSGRLADFGGSWSHGSYPGAFRLYVGRSASDSNSYYGGRLMVL